MNGKHGKKALRQRILSGEVSRQDVARRLAELAFGRANDCVKLVLEEKPELETLDLNLLSEVRRNEKGTVEVRLIDRLQALEQLSMMAKEDHGELEDFLQAIQGPQR